MNDDNTESDPIPLQYQRAFGGAGIKRKRVDFVAESRPSVQVATISTAPSASIKDLYLSIVLPTEHVPVIPVGAPQGYVVGQVSDFAAEGMSVTTSTIICSICNLPLSTAHTPHIPHESTLAHQLSLPHTHPPSHIDRQSKGLAYLNSYGWDPDARTGLGAVGEGRLYPIKVDSREISDRTGIGVDAAQLQEEKRREAERTLVTKKTVAGKGQKLLQEKAKAKEKKMRDLFYGRDDVNKYLGIQL